jgi:hypothetical protein
MGVTKERKVTVVYFKFSTTKEILANFRFIIQWSGTAFTRTRTSIFT